MPEVRPWARVVGDVNIHLRRGAWYEVVHLFPDCAVLHVSERSLTIPRSCLEIAAVRPRQWSVVSRPYDAIDLPISWGARYGVCPHCSHLATDGTDRIDPVASAPVAYCPWDGSHRGL